jgi:hypothetical protein
MLLWVVIISLNYTLSGNPHHQVTLTISFTYTDISHYTNHLEATCFRNGNGSNLMILATITRHIAPKLQNHFHAHSLP